jgi:GT2 family glycosyltransferase
VEVLLGAALFMPREVFRGCGPWDEGYTFGGEDLDLCYRIGRRHRVIYNPGVEVIHYGQTSTRLNPGFALPHITNGFLRYLRQTGCPRPALWAYKIVMTLDAPVQIVEKAAQYLWRRARGRRRDADKSLAVVRGRWHFLRSGLLALWRT